MTNIEKLAYMMRYSGVHRGFVVDVCDPENKHRARVRVPSLHGTPTQTPTSLLPWAERSLSVAGTNHGEFAPLSGPSTSDGTDGDCVYVMFDGCNASLPVIIGCWARTTDVPFETLTADAQRRRYIDKTRGGLRVERGEEPGDQEFKVTTPKGHCFHIRESDGGRGIHVTTASGHTLSLCDETPGTSGGQDLGRPYEIRTKIDNTTEQVPVGQARTPNGTAQSPTAGTGRSAGKKAAMIRTAGGHLLMMDDDGRKVTLRTTGGLSLVMDDNNMSFVGSTPAGNVLTMRDGLGVSIVSQFNQSLTMGPTGFGMRQGDGSSMRFEFGATTNWYFSGNMTIAAGGTVTINSGSDMTIFSSGNATLQAAGVLSEIGSSRIESPPVGPP